MKREITKQEINVRSLQAICGMLSGMAPDCRFFVQETYRDYGAGMMWDTIICQYRADCQYQMLSPREFDRIGLATTIDELSEIAETLYESQKHIFGNKGRG